MVFFSKIKNKIHQKLMHLQYLKLERGSPVSASIEHVHLGSENGGWFIPKNLLQGSDVPKTIYGVGAGEDISFDVVLAMDKNFSIFCFDPTPRAIQHFNLLTTNTKQNIPTPINKSKTDFYQITPEQLGRLHFLELGVWSENCELKFYEPQNPEHVSHSAVNLQKTDKFFIAKCKTISSIMKQLGHATIDLLKIDIEGAEYEVIRSIVQEKTFPSIFCVEFDEMHSPKDLGFADRILNTIELLKKSGYQLTHKDRCNFTFCLNSYLGVHP